VILQNYPLLRHEKKRLKEYKVETVVNGMIGKESLMIH